ncbi:MAG: hypothetical protein CVV32_10980 [Methanomicrobiales archaeon HGW-Methanomicrobiales-3]|nr:MAG: hypothetical protein CVV32_10980 [Methanomicrobiales archaeon HGW-Methanomicrobiales-3]
MSPANDPRPVEQPCSGSGDPSREPLSRAREAQLNAIIAASPVPEFVIDNDHHVISWNRALENATGLKAAAILGTDHHWKAFYAEVRPCLADLIVDGFTAKIPVLYPHSYQRADLVAGAYEVTDFFPALGSRGKWLHLIAAPLMDDNGTMIGAVETLEDISTFIGIQKELQESEERYSSLFSNNASVSLLIDPDTGRIVDANDAAVRYYGYPRDRLVSMGIFDLNRLPEEKVVNNLIRAKQEKAKHFQSVHYRAGGEKRFVEVYSGPITVQGKALFYSIIHDITDRKLAEEQLRESESKFSTIFQNSPVVLTLVSATDGKITDVNDAFVRKSGYSRNEALGKTSEELGLFPDPDDPGRIQSALRNSQCIYDLEIQIRTKSGDMRTCQFSACLVPMGKNPAILATIEDITDRKTAEAELQKNQFLLSEAMDMAMMADWEFDVESATFTFNDRFYALYATTAEREGGYRMPAEVYMREFTYPDDQPIVADEITKALARPEPGYIALREHRIIRRDGEIRYIIVRIRVTRDASGRTIGTHGANQDITERKMAEIALRESEERYRSLIDQLPDYVIVHRNGILLYVNPAGAATISNTAQTLVGTSFLSLVAPESHAIVRQAAAQRMQGEEVPPYEIKIAARDGTYHSVLVHGALIQYEGGPASINVLTDITPLKEAEKAIRQANEDLEKRVLERTEDLTAEIAARALAEQEISRSLEEKVLLLREIHHRVKNNLQIITSLLKLQSRFITDPGVLEAIRDTQSRVRAMSLVHERIYRSPDIAEINLKDYLLFLVKQVAQFYNVQQHRIALSVTMPEIMADIDMVTPLGLIMNELVSNSFKHAFADDRRGSISIDGTLQGADRLRFVYRDTGVGMPEGFDWKRTESLGLRLVNNLVDQLDGTIATGTGEGTSFIIDIPLKNVHKIAERALPGNTNPDEDLPDEPGTTGA